jgi:hypothetical protein
MNQTERETITVGPFRVRFLIESSDSAGSVSVFECDVPADATMAAPHSHDGFEETIYGLEGTTTWTIDGDTVEVGVGEALCVGRGPRIREPRQRRREVPRHLHARPLRAGLLPRGRRDPGGLGGGPA